MAKEYLLILINMRKKDAVTVQKILTEWGCIIKTRLGLHSGVTNDCSEVGTIFIELAGEKEKHQELTRKLNLLEGVSAKIVTMEI